MAQISTRKLRQRGVKNPDGVLEEHHPQPAEHPLQHHGQERGQPQASQPFRARLAARPNPARAKQRQAGEPKDQAIGPAAGHRHRCAAPENQQGGANPAHERAGAPPIEPQSERDRQQADPGGGQAMGVLVEDASHPLGNREEEHVITVGVGPVGHGHAGAVTGHQAANGDQPQRGEGREHRETMQAGVVRGCYSGRHGRGRKSETRNPKSETNPKAETQKPKPEWLSETSEAGLLRMGLISYAVDNAA